MTNSRLFTPSAFLAGAGLLGTLGCSGGQPDKDRIAVAPNGNSVLSALVTFALPEAAQVRVLSVAGQDDLSTPPLESPSTGDALVAVLGLKAGTAYTHTVEGMTATGLPVSVSASRTTPPLPDDLQPLGVRMSSASAPPGPGYYLVSGAGNAAFAVDGAGVIRWYRDFGQGTGETKMQPDGTFTTYVGESIGSEPVPGSYIRYRPDGTQLATYSAASPDETEPDSPPVYTDPHELLLTSDSAGNEHVHLFGYVLRGEAVGSTPMAWHEVLRQSPSGVVEFRWKSWTRFSISDQLESELPWADDADHPDALAIDPADGNYVVSLRNMDAVVKVDSQTGDVVWQLGGNQNQFAILGDPLGGFQGQHSVRVLPNGDILLYDNGLHHDPPESRAAEYRLDTAAMTATLVWEFRHSPAIETPYVGSAERLQNGHTLVAFAWAGLVDEVDTDGSLLWEGQLVSDLTPRQCYRIRSLPSLYSYQAP